MNEPEITSSTVEERREFIKKISLYRGLRYVRIVQSCAKSFGGVTRSTPLTRQLKR